MPVLRGLDEVGVHHLLARRAVPGDVDRAAVVEVGVRDVLRARHECAPDAHAGALGLDLDAELLPDVGVQAVGADEQVVAAGRAVAERHVDAVVVLREARHRGAVVDAGAELGGAVGEDAREVGTVHARRRPGTSGPPVGASGICAMTGASGPGARRPSRSKA